MKNISTGTGIALLAGAIVAYPIIDRVMPKADASATHTAAVIAAATAQVEPTIVWYGVHGVGGESRVFRAWSDGLVEAKQGYTGSATNPSTGQYDRCIWTGGLCDSWVIVSSPDQGYASRSDVTFDSKVDGADLGTLLADWGDAPRHDIPPSDCPLNLINP